jgi:hypothetical protein
MTKKIVLSAILVTFILLLQFGCQTTDATKEPAPESSGLVKETTAQEAAPAAKEKFVLRVDCGSFEQYTDKAGNIWQADQELYGDATWGAEYGQTIGRPGLGIEGTDCPIIYESERYSMDSYVFGVPNGKYTVKLHFCETYEGILDVGYRVFSVSINGKQVLENVDPYKDSGEFYKPLVKTFKGVEPVDGKIVVGFTPNIENPQINGIEIISE